MKIFQNISGGVKLFRNLKHLNKYKNDIQNARNNEDYDEERKFILQAMSTWGKELCKDAGVELKVFGKENLPEIGPVVYMPNHQGYADVVVLCAALDTIQTGFIARNDLESVPFYGKWIDKVRGVTINRKNPKDGLKAINRGIDLIKKGFSLVIFPEGTRSRKPEMGEFKAGAMKLATKPQIPIIPVSIDGTWRVFEEKGCIQKCEVKILIHEAISTENLSREEEKQMATKVQNIVNEGLKKLREMK